jgi:adenosylcobinamide kinase/adenosylcobinamide-phosphate guanylyltransferase
MTGSRGPVRRRELILILGGARGGKSSFAQSLAHSMSDSVTFIAPAEAGDEEMRRRIEEHRRSRPPSWQTIEEPLHPASALANAPKADVVVLDCVTLLVSNLLLAHEGSAAEAEQVVDAEIAALLRAYQDGGATFIIASNEVGMGVVPPYALGRAYRDLLGRANQCIARAADRVYWMLAGLPIEMKASGIAEKWRETVVQDS